MKPMYRVMIVDDEPEICMGIRLKVDWHQLGLEAAAEASNGEEALKILEDGEIDIVITDMNMPVADGVAFLAECRRRFPHVRLIVLTGYEDFAYAHAAIRSQAKDYLLKPVSGEELETSLRTVAGELREERRARDERARMEWRLSAYYRQMKEDFLIRLVLEPVWDEKAIRERLETFELDRWDARRVRFVAAGLKETGAAAGRENAGKAGPAMERKTAPLKHAAPSDRRAEQFRLPFELMCREIAETLPERPPSFPDGRDLGLFLFMVPDDASAIDGLMRSLGSAARRYLRMEAAFGVGEPVTGFAAWKEGYLSALLAWHGLAGSEPFRAEPHRADEEARPAPRESGDASGGAGLEQTILRFLDQGHLDALERTLQTELEAARRISRGRFVRSLFQLRLLADTVARTFRIPAGPEDPLWLRPELALRFNTAEEAARDLMRTFHRIHLAVRERDGDADRFRIEAVQKFIRENYMYDLNLKSLAQRFHYHPSYFSELFKAKTGKSFIRYLTEVRMEQAVRLLRETSLGLWDIAELCGFSGPGYFSSRFKQMYGISPSEFRQRTSEKFDGA
jgi:two-component system response regulator YesN